jgi:hypothetical protein
MRSADLSVLINVFLIYFPDNDTIKLVNLMRDQHLVRLFSERPIQY